MRFQIGDQVRVKVTGNEGSVYSIVTRTYQVYFVVFLPQPRTYHYHYAEELEPLPTPIKIGYTLLEAWL